MTRSLAIASGKGGVGKTTVSVNLSLALSQAGKRTILLDADFGMANSHVLLGVNPQNNIGDFLRGRKKISELIIEGPSNLKFIAGGSGVNDLLTTKENERYRVIRGMEELKNKTDILIIDAAAGGADSTLDFVSSADLVLVVVEGEPTSLMDAYALIKSANLERKVKNFLIFINKASSEVDAKKTFSIIERNTNKFLDARVSFSGYLLLSNALKKAVIMKKPIMISNRKSKEGIAFQKLASSVIKSPVNEIEGLKFFA